MEGRIPERLERLTSGYDSGHQCKFEMSSTALTFAQDAKVAEVALDRLLSKSGKGGKVLLKDPHSSTHSSWHLWLPPHFNTSLDLRLLWRQQTKNKEVVRKWKEWAQGSIFCFNEGAIIYDRDVTGLETWGDKLDAIDFYVVIGQSRPVTMRSGSNLKAGFDDGANRDPGLVSFRIYTPTTNHGSAIEQEHTVTQDCFVRFAISGEL